jgi:hypothetical protein
MLAVSMLSQWTGGRLSIIPRRTAGRGRLFRSPLVQQLWQMVVPDARPLVCSAITILPNNAVLPLGSQVDQPPHLNAAGIHSSAEEEGNLTEKKVNLHG